MERSSTYAKDLKKKPRYPCTSCGKDIITQKEAKKHPLLNTLQCVTCNSSYNLVGDLSKYRGGVDLDGQDNYCRWCLDGGELVLCNDENCRSGFCNSCIERNMGTKGLQEITQSQSWFCFVCDYTQLQKHRASAESALKSLSRSGPPLKSILKKNQSDTTSINLPSPQVKRTITIASQSPTTNTTTTVSTPTTTVSAPTTTVLAPTTTVSAPTSTKSVPTATKSVPATIKSALITTKSTPTITVSAPTTKSVITPKSVPVSVSTTTTTSTVIPVSSTITTTSSNNTTTKKLPTSFSLFSSSKLLTKPKEKAPEKKNPTPKETNGKGLLTEELNVRIVTETSAKEPVSQVLQTKELPVHDSSVKEPPVHKSLQKDIIAKEFLSKEPITNGTNAVNVPVELPKSLSKTVSETTPTKVSATRLSITQDNREDVPMELEDELYISDDSSDGYMEAADSFPDSNEQTKDEDKKDVVLNWALKDAALLKKRLKIHVDALSTAFDTYDEVKFKADPKNLTSWLSNIEVYLKSTPLIVDRCRNIYDFITTPES